MTKRTIEIFSAGCPCCLEAIQLVRSMACESCDVQVLDMRNDEAAQARARQYGVQRIPAVAINGMLSECCQGALNAETLREMGMGTRL